MRVLQALKFPADVRPDPSRSQGATDDRVSEVDSPAGTQRAAAPAGPFRQNALCAGLRGQEVRHGPGTVREDPGNSQLFKLNFIFFLLPFRPEMV